MLGTHCLKSWSSTQPSVSLSSGEAEFYGLVKAAGIGLGFQALMQDVGREIACRVWTDSAAAMGIVGRQGLGRLRHIDTHSLWVQQAARSGRIQVRKVKGEDNPADIFTKHLPARDKVTQLVGLLGCRYDAGRPDASPDLRRERLTHSTLGQAMGECSTSCREAFGGEYDEGVEYVMGCVGEAGDARRGVLPHLHTEAEIDDLFPSMPLLGEDSEFIGPDFLTPGTRTDVEDHGEEIAERILEKARREGRRRKTSVEPC